MRLLEVQGKQLSCTNGIVRVCRLCAPWYETVSDFRSLVDALGSVRPRPHLFTFFQRVPRVVPEYAYPLSWKSVAVISLSDYETWWKEQIGKKTRHAVRKAQKSGVDVCTVSFGDQLVAGIHAIYSETPIRQGRRFAHFGDTLEEVRRANASYLDRSEFIGAYVGSKLVGFAKIVFEQEFADILQFLASVDFRDARVANALMAKVVERCCDRGFQYVAYGEWDSGSLTDFKRHNGFTQMKLPEYHVPLTLVGRVILRLGLHRPVRKLLPRRVAAALYSIRRSVNSAAAR